MLLGIISEQGMQLLRVLRQIDIKELCHEIP